LRLLLTGDSIIARKEGLAEPRLNATLKSMHPGWQIENTAVSGINSEALLVQLPQLVLQRPAADAVTILVGTNDLARNKQVPLARYRQNLAGIAVSVTKQYAPKRVIFISPPAVDETKQRMRDNQLIKAYAQGMAATAAAYQCRYVDLRSAMMQTGQLSELCRGSLNDGLHFGQPGYDVLAHLISETVTQRA
jgi:lysophospholipase L1-like esterase